MQTFYLEEDLEEEQSGKNLVPHVASFSEAAKTSKENNGSFHFTPVYR